MSAYIAKSIDRTWPRFAAVIPGRKTKWFVRENTARRHVRWWKEKQARIHGKEAA
jgi:hypothetical protein